MSWEARILFATQIRMHVLQVSGENKQRRRQVKIVEVNPDVLCDAKVLIAGLTSVAFQHQGSGSVEALHKHLIRSYTTQPSPTAQSS